MRPEAIELITADTFRTPDEGLTAGSHSMQHGGTALQYAAATVRMLLTRAAAKTWKVAPETVATTGNGHLRSADGRTLSYGTVAAALALHTEALADAPVRNPQQFRTMGKSVPRIDRSLLCTRLLRRGPPDHLDPQSSAR